RVGGGGAARRVDGVGDPQRRGRPAVAGPPKGVVGTEVPLAPVNVHTSQWREHGRGTEDWSDQGRVGPNGRQEVAAWSLRAACPSPWSRRRTRPCAAPSAPPRSRSEERRVG